ncbi:MAG TPA: tRNA pseudouridine(38-40) synthase TruA [Eudoraea sp.]|nr:tRNA pseudouridine(38-40) synthase TruA [Eudoraea sp.]
MRYFVTFSYFGKAYHGWQSQPNAVTVQQLMEEVFSTILRQDVSLAGAGRTDAGVHARKMVAHFDCAGPLEAPELIQRFNAFLPDDIAVQQLVRVPDAAHARFSALKRTYEYWIIQEKNPFYQDMAHYVRQPLNLSEMNKAASFLMDFEDFQCFSKSKTDVRTYTCRITEAVWKKYDRQLVFTISADRFLRNMVRAIVGTLVEVGQGKLNPQDVKTIIKSRDRALAGVSVPAKGLYLTEIVYPTNILEVNG